MPAAAAAGMLLDLNLSLQQHSTSTTTTTTTPSPPSQHYEPPPPPPLSASPADREVHVVGLTIIPSSASAGEFEDGGSQLSQNSTTLLTRKRTHHHHHHHHPEQEETHLAPCPSPRGGGGGGGGGASEEEEEEELDGDSNSSRKKLRLSREQSLLLEVTFKDHNTLSPRQKQALAKQLGLSARQVEVWFQNRRARTKLKQTEAECEYMKRNCETLVERVRRLQKEVNALRSLKLAPQIYMHMPPAATLTLCPSCERLGIPMSTPRASAGAECSNVGQVGSVSSSNLWASSNPMIHKPHF